MILETKGDYFLKQQKQIDFRNSEMCFLSGTVLISYILFRRVLFQRINELYIVSKESSVIYCSNQLKNNKDLMYTMNVGSLTTHHLLTLLSLYNYRYF